MRGQETFVNTTSATPRAPQLKHVTDHGRRGSYGAMSLSVLRAGRQEDPWHSFLLEAEPALGTQCGWKDCVN
jgi:hypothetical protein